MDYNNVRVMFYKTNIQFGRKLKICLNTYFYTISATILIIIVVILTMREKYTGKDKKEGLKSEK